MSKIFPEVNIYIVSESEEFEEFSPSEEIDEHYFDEHYCPSPILGISYDESEEEEELVTDLTYTNESIIHPVLQQTVNNNVSLNNVSLLFGTIEERELIQLLYKAEFGDDENSDENYDEMDAESHPDAYRLEDEVYEHFEQQLQFEALGATQVVNLSIPMMNSQSTLPYIDSQITLPYSQSQLYNLSY